MGEGFANSWPGWLRAVLFPNLRRMNPYDWAEEFRELFEKSVLAYRGGKRDAGSLFSPKQKAFLATLGATPQEIFVFVEDHARGGEPSLEATLLVTAVRRDYFLFEQQGRWSQRVVAMASLPAKSAAVDGIAWLPRLIVKARAKLRGEMPPELMYGCGGDRPFLRGVNIHLADFLRVVWAAGEDDRPVVEYVQRAMRGG